MRSGVAVPRGGTMNPLRKVVLRLEFGNGNDTNDSNNERGST